MYTGHGPGPDMVGYMTKYDTVGQSRRNILRHGDTQPRFNLHPQLIDVRIRGGGLLHVMPSMALAVEAVGGRGQIVAATRCRMPVGGGRLHLQFPKGLDNGRGVACRRRLRNRGR